MFFVTNIAIAQEAFEEHKCIQTLEKTCIEQREREIDGFKVNRCWKYEERFKCVGHEENHCSTFEENRGCNQLSAQCLEESNVGACKHFEKKFKCGLKTDETEEIKLIDTEYETLKDEKDLSACESQEIDKYCQLESETCVEKGETRNINGKDIYKDCWKWDRKYICKTNTFIDECKELKEKGCVQKTRECIHEEDGRCDHYIVEYECEKNKTEKIDCLASRFCIGDVCEEQQRNSNDNFGLAASYLSVLSQVQKDGEGCGCDGEKDPNCSLSNDNCQLFKGRGFFCKSVTGEYNCCSQKGFVRPLIGCGAEEKELQSKRQAKLCHFVGSWKKKPFNLVQKKSYCCFNSPLARIIQEQGRAQLGIGWGDRKNPDCRALTLQEIQKIDFSKINFTELYADLKSKAEKDFSEQGQQIKQKLKNLKSSPSMSNGQMHTKMKGFYEKK